MVHPVSGLWLPEQCQAWIPSQGVGFKSDYSDHICATVLSVYHTDSHHCRLKGFFVGIYPFPRVVCKVPSNAMNTGL